MKPCARGNPVGCLRRPQEWGGPSEGGGVPTYQAGRPRGAARRQGPVGLPAGWGPGQCQPPRGARQDWKGTGGTEMDWALLTAAESYTGHTGTD